MISTTPEAVVRQAQNLVSGKNLQIADDYLQEGQWLHLIVTPIGSEGSALDFINEIEKVELELRKRFGDEILIVPAKP